MIHLTRLIPVSFFLLITLLLSAQKSDTLEASRLIEEAKKDYYSGKVDFKLALNKARKARNILQAVLGPKDQRVAEAWYWMGTYANYLPNEHSRDYFYKSYLIYRELWGEYDNAAIITKANYGSLFGFAGDHETCIKILKECERNTERSPNVAIFTKGFIYGEIGQASQELNEVEYYTKKCIQLFASVNKPGAWANVGVCYNTLALMFFESRDFVTARQYGEQAISIVSKYQSPDHPNAAVYLSTLAAIFFELKQMDSTLVYCQRAEQVLRKNYDTPHPTLINIKTLEGEVWAQRGQKDKALQAWTAALKVAHSPGNEIFSVHYNNLCLARAKYHLQHKQYSEATAWCDSITFNSRFHSPKTLDNALDQGGVIKALSLHNQILASQLDATIDPKTLRTFNQALFRMLECVKVLKTATLGRQFDPVTLNEALLPSIEAALDVEQQKTQSSATRLSQQFSYLQLAKAEVLTNAFQANRLTQIAGVPETLLQREKDGKNKLADLKSKVAKAEAAKDSSALQKLYAEQFEEKKRYDRLQAQLQKQYPKLATLRGTAPAPSLSDVHKKLLPDAKTALIEYFVGERSIYIFQITRSSAQSWKITKPSDFDDLVRRFHATASDHVLLQRDPALAKQRYVEAANRLSTLLLQKPLQQLPTSIQHLIIVPDANLHYLVFDALFTQPAKVQSAWRDLPYLLNKYAVSYGFSTGLLMEQYARAGKRPAQGFLGFAPQYKASKLKSNDTLRLAQLALRVRNGEYELPGAQKEVAAIAELTGGRQVRAAEASEANFRRYAGDYAVLHLAMHAILDDRYPALSGLLFTPNSADTTYDNHLTLAEIYGLSLSAELAVLTACNSGAGKLRRGEGILSLGRAFTFAGVRSTVMSQWQAADQQTSRLMLLFYQELEKGLQKDVALQVAKQQYLATAQNPDLGHPFFWAGFVLNGNAEPLSLPNPYGWYWVVLGLAAALGIGWWILRRKRTEK